VPDKRCYTLPRVDKAELALAETRKLIYSHNLRNGLGDERARSALTENLWRHLSVVYLERRGGLNLRKDLAHGQVDPKSFNRSIADRVVHTLLVMGLMRPSK
jgi:hypothetical protein